MSIQAIIWDMGGVILQMTDERPRRELASRLGIDLELIYQRVFSSETARRAMIGEMSIGEHWQAVIQSLNLPLSELPAFVDQFWAADGLDDRVVDYIRSLRPGYKTGLLSNAWDDLRQVLVEKWKIADLFDELIISAEVGLAKPDLRIYQLAVERLGVAASEAVFLDDVAENAQAARAAGLHGVHFRDFDQARAELEALLDSRPLHSKSE